MITVNILYNKTNLKILMILFYEGFIEGFRVLSDFILVFLKYNFLNRCLF